MLHGTKFEMGSLGRPHLRHLEDDALPGARLPGSAVGAEVADDAVPRPAPAPAAEGSRPAPNTLAQLPPTPIQQRLTLIRAPLPASPRQAPPALPTPVATAAATVAAPVTAAAPTASPAEMAALELTLADPLNRELVAAHGGRATAPAGSATAQSLTERYGADLAGRLTQLHRAQAAVESHYLQALDAAAQRPGQGVPGWTLIPGHMGAHDTGWIDDRWQFDASAFTRDYARGNDVAQRAFAATHGSEPLHTTVEVTESADVHTTTLGTRATLRLGQWEYDEYTPAIWRVTRLESAPLQRVDPNAPPKLHDPQAVWFDPGIGWVTERANVVVKQDFFDKAFPVVAAIGAVWLTGGMAAAAGSAVGGGTLGAAAQAGVSALAASTASQLVGSGRLDFGQLLRSTLGGALTGGLMQASGAAQALKSASFATRAMAITGQATVQARCRRCSAGASSTASPPGWPAGWPARSRRR